MTLDPLERAWGLHIDAALGANVDPKIICAQPLSLAAMTQPACHSHYIETLHTSYLLIANHSYFTTDRVSSSHECSSPPHRSLGRSWLGSGLTVRTLGIYIGFD